MSGFLTEMVNFWGVTGAELILKTFGFASAWRWSGVCSAWNKRLWF